MPSSSRLYFLDWVRIVAFLLLIVYHVGMYYVSWDWHIKSPHASSAIEPLMMLSSPWRLGLLFLISGVASGYMLKKLGAARFLRQRSVRLLLPLLFGMLVIVPPQAYFEVVEKLAYQGGYADFMRLYVSGYGGFCRAGDCLDLPTWNHLWFVAYLWVYTLVLGALLWMLGERFDAVSRAVLAGLQGWKLIAIPAAVLALLRVTLLPHFEITHGLVDDWYNHAQSLTLFVAGAMLSRQAGMWQRLDDLRWWGLALALSCWGVFSVYYALPETLTLRPELAYWRSVMRVLYALCGWCAIVAACGFAHRHLNRDNASRRYLTEAVFPVYIAHQTLIVSIAHLAKPAGIAPATEAVILTVLTLCLSFGIFECVRRVAVLRPLFGLSLRPLQDRLAPACMTAAPARQSAG